MGFEIFRIGRNNEEKIIVDMQHDKNLMMKVSQCVRKHSVGEHNTKCDIKILFEHSKILCKNNRYKKAPGIPMNIALKRKNGFKIDSNNRYKAKMAWKDLIRNLEHEFVSDVIVPCPSSSELSKELAGDISQFTKARLIDLSEVLKVRTRREFKHLLKERLDSGTVEFGSSKNKARMYSSVEKIVSDNKIVSIKKIPQNLRGIVNPFYFSDEIYEITTSEKILIVDDFVDTGSTCLGLRDIFLQQNFDVVSVVCLIG